MSSVVLHDFFAFPGGGEKVAVSLARIANAQIITGFVDGDVIPADYWGDVSYHSLEALQKKSFLGSFSKNYSLMQAFKSVTPLEADVAFLSGGLSVFAASKLGGRKIWYCHTPPRFIFDKREHYLYQQRGLKKIGLQCLMNYYKIKFFQSLEHVDVILANSKTVQGRIQEYLQRESQVVYPPCDTLDFTWAGQDDYYLSTARVDDLKRVDIVVEAFLAMPEKKLVVVSGGSLLEEVRRKVVESGQSNIKVLGWISDDELKYLMGRCIATVYIPQDEDFGISPVESMAAGKPVIGVDEGGVRETVLHNKTGLLLPSGPLAHHVVSAVRLLDEELALSMRSACEAQAECFSQKQFVEQITAFL